MIGLWILVDYVGEVRLIEYWHIVEYPRQRAL